MMKQSTRCFWFDQVRCGAVMGLFLFSVLTPPVRTTVENLSNIIKFFQKTYEVTSQVALAINVPAQKCSKVAVLDKNFLPDDNAENVKIAMNGKDRVYQGKQLIGARPKQIPSKKANYHSEYLLLVKSNPPKEGPNDPLMQKLILDKDQNGCVIFYTVNSPCVNSCSTPNTTYSIVSALDMFKSHNGPKAFVFSKVWKHDDDTQKWADNINGINSKVPLYRCDDNGCTPCVNNGVVNDKCKGN